MAQLNNKLVTKQMPWHANMTDLNHLGAALIAKPHVFESVMTRLFSATRYSDNPMTYILSMMGKEEEITSNEWEWGLRTGMTRPLVVVENVEAVANTTPGKLKQNFKIKLDENWFVPGDVLHPGTTNKKYQVRVQEEPYRHGKGWIYTVRLMTDNAADFLPLTYLTPGTQWAKLFSQYEEAGEQSGSTQYSLPITLKNRLSRFRKKYQVTGDAHNQVLAVKVPDPNGKMHDTYSKIILGDVNNYIAITEDGKSKCKGRFEYDNLALHKNKSFLIIPKAIHAYFVDGVQPEDYLAQNQNIFDYCGGVKIKGDWSFYEHKIVNGEHSIEPVQHTIRYFVSNSGSKIIKKNNTDGREIQVEAGKWMQTIMIDYTEKEFSEYDINFKYYLDNIYKEIRSLEPINNQLSLF